MPKLPDARIDDEDRQLQEIPPLCRTAGVELLETLEHPCLARDACETGDSKQSNSSRSFSNASLQARSHDRDSRAGSIQSVSRQRVTAKGSGQLSGFPQSPSHAPGHKTPLRRFCLDPATDIGEPYPLETLQQSVALST
jgi:hypothetical protein